MSSDSDSKERKLEEAAAAAAETEAAAEETAKEETAQGALFNAPLTDERLKAVIEAIIFASDTPLSASDIFRVLYGVPRDRVRPVLKAMIAEGEQKAREGNTGFVLQEVAGGYQYRTVASVSPWLKKLQKTRPWRLTQASLETLAIVAYKQPITRGEIDQLRGVDSSAVLVKLLEKRLVKPVGRKEVPGYPMMYGTAPGFLEFFGLNELKDLPTLREIKELGDLGEAEAEVPEEIRQYMEERRRQIEAEQDGLLAEGQPAEGEVSPPASDAAVESEKKDVSYESIAGTDSKPEEGS